MYVGLGKNFWIPAFAGMTVHHSQAISSNKLRYYPLTPGKGRIPMELPALLLEMENLGTEQNRKIYRRHGIAGPQYGLSFANLKKLQKRIKKDQALAVELWATGNHDCRILATLVADPGQAGEEGLERWCAALDNYIVTDSFAGFVGQTALARQKAGEWTQRREEWPGPRRLALDFPPGNEGLGLARRLL